MAVVVGAVSLISLYVYRNITIDDAFIGWRHGLNLVRHGRYAFNPSGSAVDAATSPLFGLLGAVPAALGVDVVLFFKLLALATIASGLIFVARSTTAATETQLLTVLLMIGGPIQAIHLWSGLETGAFVICAMAVCTYALRPERGGPWVIGALGAILVSLRLDGFLFLAPAVYCYVRAHPHGWDDGDAGVGHVRTNVTSALRTVGLWLPAAAATLAILALRWVNTGSPLPNTLATKAGADVSLQSLQYNSRDFILLGLCVVVIGLLLPDGSRRTFATMSVPVALGALLVYLPADLQMNYSLRFSYQLFWPLILAGVLALTSVTGRERMAALAVFGALFLLMPLPSDRTSIDYYPRMTDAMLPLGKALRQHGGPDRTLYIGDAGQVSYLSDWVVIDTNFLGTPATLGIDGVADHIRRDQRGVLALYASGPSPEAVYGRDSALRDAGIDAGYRYVTAVCWQPNYWFQIWVAPGLQRDVELTTSLERVGRRSVAANDRFRPPRPDVLRWFWFT